MKNRVPGYCRQKEVGRHDRAYCRINGQKILLGEWQSRQSKAKYAELIAKLAEQDVPPAQGEPVAVLTDLMAEYWNFAEGHYGKDSAMMHHIRSFMRGLRQLFGDLPVDEFRAKKLKGLRNHWVAEGWTRKYCNEHVARLKRMFKWGVSEEMVLPDTLASLQSVVALRSGKTAAPDRPPIEPVSDATIEATLPYLPELIALAVQVQRLTGCRPGELLKIRKADLDRSGPVWIARLKEHKTSHRNLKREIFIGPKAQQLLLPRLVCADDALIFPIRRDSYRRAIARGCKKAGIAPWCPLQLRHTAGTEIRREFGLEAAQVALGHSRADVTEVYAERCRALGIEVAKQIG